MIRKMIKEDLSQVCAIENEIFSDAWTMQGFLDTLENSQAIMLVAASDEDGSVEGYCCLYQAFDEGEIVNVAVHPDKRCRGIGYKMVEELMQQGILEGISHFYLEVRESNVNAQKLYEKLGFEMIGIRKDFYEKPRENAIIMQKIL